MKPSRQSWQAPLSTRARACLATQPSQQGYRLRQDLDNYGIGYEVHGIRHNSGEIHCDSRGTRGGHGVQLCFGFPIQIQLSHKIRENRAVDPGDEKKGAGSITFKLTYQMDSFQGGRSRGSAYHKPAGNATKRIVSVKPIICRSLLHQREEKVKRGCHPAV